MTSARHSAAGARETLATRLARLRETAGPDEAAARSQAILAARARALAAPPPPPPGSGVETLGFVVGGEAYALETRWIAAVFALRELTPLPGTPDFVLGILHFRGRILSVLDLRKFLELPGAGMSNSGYVILISDNCMEFGLRADALGSLEKLAEGALQAPPGSLGGRSAGCLLGVTREGRAVLDGARLLADPALVVGAGQT